MRTVLRVDSAVRYRLDHSWRLERFCYPELFVKATLDDVLKNLGVIPERDIIAPNGPGPDLAPFVLKDGGLTLERIAQAGRQTALKLAAAESAAAIGAKTSTFEEPRRRCGDQDRTLLAFFT